MAVCSHCGYEAPAFQSCPLCGTVAAGDGDRLERDSAENVGTPAPLPAWEDPDVGFPRSFIETWKESIFRPAAFFRGVPWGSAAARPFLYYLLVSIIGAVFSLWWQAAYAALGLPLGFAETDSMLAMSGTTTALLNFFGTPFLAVIAIIVWGGLIQLLLLIFARERRGFGATVRAICYGSGPSLMLVVPVFGALIGLFWTIALTGMGLREAHRMSTGSAATVMIIAVALPALVIFMGIALLYSALFTYS